MPQLDKFIFVDQSFFIFLFFIIIYYINTVYIIPLLSFSIKMRYKIFLSLKIKLFTTCLNIFKQKKINLLILLKLVQILNPKDLIK